MKELKESSYNKLDKKKKILEKKFEKNWKKNLMKKKMTDDDAFKNCWKNHHKYCQILNSEIDFRLKRMKKAPEKTSWAALEDYASVSHHLKLALEYTQKL